MCGDFLYFRFCIDCGVCGNFNKRYSEKAYLFSKIHLTIGRKGDINKPKSFSGKSGDGIKNRRYCNYDGKTKSDA